MKWLIPRGRLSCTIGLLGLLVGGRLVGGQLEASMIFVLTNVSQFGLTDIVSYSTVCNHEFLEGLLNSRFAFNLGFQA